MFIMKCLLTLVSSDLNEENEQANCLLWSMFFTTADSAVWVFFVAEVNLTYFCDCVHFQSSSVARRGVVFSWSMLVGHMRSHSVGNTLIFYLAAGRFISVLNRQYGGFLRKMSWMFNCLLMEHIIDLDNLSARPFTFSYIETPLTSIITINLKFLFKSKLSVGL